MPSDKEVVKKRTVQQKKVYIEDSSDEESDEDGPRPKRGWGCLERCTLSPVEEEPPNKSTTDRLSFLSQKISLLTSSPQKTSTSEVSCMTLLFEYRATNFIAGVLTKDS